MASGCVLSYVDDTGARRVIGLADVAVRPADAYADDGNPDRMSHVFTGHVVTIRAFGLAANGDASSSSVTLGYVSHTSAFLRNCDQADGRACGPERITRLDGIRESGFFQVADRGAGKEYFGFVNLSIPPPPAGARVAGHYLDQSTVGIAFSRIGTQRVLDLGYGHNALAIIGSNVLVAGNPMNAKPVEPALLAERAQIKTDIGRME